MYINKVGHTHYCGQLARYRYENDYSTNDQKIKYAPKKSHLIFTGQDMGLHTVTYTFEKDEEVYFRYLPKKNFKKPNEIVSKESPFEVLKKLNLN